MADDPVKFKSRAEQEAEREAEANKYPLILVCSHCSCSTWYAHADGTLVCAHCDEAVHRDTSEWFKPLDTNKQPLDSPTLQERSVIDFNSASAERDGQMAKNKTIDDLRTKDVFGFIYVCNDGYVGTWGKDGKSLTAEQKKWAANRFAMGVEVLVMPDAPPKP